VGTRAQPIRTTAEVPLAFSLLETRPAFAYQRIAREAVRLRELGMSASSIARLLGVTDKTVTKAIRRSRFGT
jgi:transposase-like protein